MLYLLFAFLLSTQPAPARAADRVEEARQKNPDVRAARAQARADTAAVSSAGALDDPMLLVQLWNMPVDLSTVPLMLNITQAIPLGGKRAARRDEATGMADASRFSAETRARDVEADVAKAYFD